MPSVLLKHEETMSGGDMEWNKGGAKEKTEPEHAGKVVLRLCIINESDMSTPESLEGTFSQTAKEHKDLLL